MSSRTQRVLVIEDDQTIADVIRLQLEQDGLTVEVAPDGAAGLEAAAREHPDLIVADLLTPRMHGYEVIRRIRASHGTCRIPILVLSAQAYAADQRKAMQMGADAFLSKPFELDELGQTVRRILDTMRVRFWGVRGSIATPGPETVRYGGNTPCVTVESGEHQLILDAGTGLRKLGLTLAAEARGKPVSLSMLITHTHWDHIQGFPFFVPAFVPGNHIEVHGPPSVDKPLEKVLRGQMDPEYFPVSLGDMAADIEVHEIRERNFTVGGFAVTARYVNHPGVTMAYRIECDDRVVVYATDIEPYKAQLSDPSDTDGRRAEFGRQRDADLIDLIRGADLYIADSQYSPDEYQRKRGWGHSCYLDAVELALLADAKRIALFSHDPMHDDDMVDEKLRTCREVVAEKGSDLQVIAAAEGRVVELVRPGTL